MLKVSFNHNISQDVADIFEKLVKKVGAPRHAIVEAAILALDALPLDIILRLKAPDPEERAKCFDRLSELSLEPNKTGRRSRLNQENANSKIGHK